MDLTKFMVIYTPGKKKREGEKLQIQILKLCVGKQNDQFCLICFKNGVTGEIMEQQCDALLSEETSPATLPFQER